MSVSHLSMVFGSVNSGFNRRFVVTMTIVLVGVLLTSCSEGKVAQCNRLIEIANQAANQVESVTQSSSPEDTEAFMSIAESANNAANQLESLEIEDETLQGFQERFISLYVETSAATEELVNAVNAQDAPGAVSAYEKLERATSQEGPLVDEVNTYCGGTP